MQAPSSHKAELELGPLDEAGPPEDKRDDGANHELQEEDAGGNTEHKGPEDRLRPLITRRLGLEVYQIHSSFPR